MEAKKRLPVKRKRIESRVAGRELARELLQVVDQWHLEDPDLMEAVVEVLEVYTPRNKPKEPATVEPIARLGATLIPFGQHCGKDFDGTPIDYLDWLCREQEGFYKRLRDYLKHPELEGRRRGL